MLLPALALLWNLVVIINYRDCPRVLLAPVIFFCIFPRLPPFPCPAAGPTPQKGPNNLEAAPSRRGKRTRRIRSHSRSASGAPNDRQLARELRASALKFFSCLVCPRCLLYRRRKGKSPTRTGTASPHQTPCSELGLPGMDTNSTSFSSPLASPQNVNVNIPVQLEYVVDAISHASFWTVLWTVLAVAVVYDQSMFYPQSIAAK